ncbi:helix-turn-helix domain-containing protein [Brevibacillus brevis]|uniref:helix-turn-helix domain-containing protein n=1 Tax=Brevibacillus brevis TaxID=1393 RepID=UPI000E394794|nr:helix-turn-helix protein [Brevibacillus brevis]GEC92133.1 hypothetical protein BBR01nite_44640 [Brevibacillus brevis]VEF90180.1 Helix-turn-helix [Brevibacillus brevis]
MSLVGRIQDLCSSKNTTLIGLEREIGLGRGTIRNWDKNSPSVDKVQKVSEYFGVSTDYLLYGFDKSELTSFINLIRYKRSIKEFALDTGLDEFYLNRLCSGVEYTQPSIDSVLKIAVHNENDWLVDAESLFKAAGYDLGEMSDDLLEDIPIELLHHYQKQGMSETEMVIAYARFREAEFKEAMSEPSNTEESSSYEPETIAAHHDGDEWTEEELAEIELFKQFVKTKRKQQE